MYGRNCCGGLPRPFRNTTRGASSCSRMTRAVSPPTEQMELPGVRILVMREDEWSGLRRQIESDYAAEDILLYCPKTFALVITGWRMCSNTARYSARITGRCSLRNCASPTAWICGAMRGRWDAFSPAGIAWRSWARSGRITAASWKGAGNRRG